MMKAAFVAQSCADIQRKLQKLEGFSGMNATQLLEVANKVSVDSDRNPNEKQIKNETESGPASSGTEELRSRGADHSLVERGN